MQNTNEYAHTQWHIRWVRRYGRIIYTGRNQKIRTKTVENLPCVPLYSETFAKNLMTEFFEKDSSISR